MLSESSRAEPPAGLASALMRRSSLADVVEHEADIKLSARVMEGKVLLASLCVTQHALNDVRVQVA